jgi:hypothetical protein
VSGRRERPGCLPIQELSDEPIDFRCNTVLGQRVADRAPLAHEMRALAQRHESRDSLGFRGIRQFPVQRLPVVEFWDWELPYKIVEVPRITPTARLHRNNAR